MPQPACSPETLDRWHAELRLFRFHRAAGGHANDGDMLCAALPIAGEPELVRLFDRLERPLVVLPPDAVVPVLGESYTLEEYEALRHPIRAFPKYESLGRTTLFGVSVYVSISHDEVGISLSGAEGDPYFVTERDFEHALAIERELGSRDLLPK